VITLTLHATESPPVVLGALGARSGEWRESRIPEGLRRARIIAVDCRVTGNTCTLVYQRRWYAGVDRVAALQLRARVDPDPQGGTIVRVNVSHSRHARSAVFALVFFVVACFTFGGSSGLAVAGLGLAMAGFNYVLVRDANRGLRRGSDPEADYLVRRIEETLANVEDVVSPDINAAPKNAAPITQTGRPPRFVYSSVMAVALLGGTLFFADIVSEYRTRETLVHATAGSPRILLNGMPVDDPSVLVAAVRQLRHVWAHHSSPGEAICLEFVTGHDTTSINLARDSERPDEFWVYRAGANWHNDELGQEAGRIESPSLNGYLKSRGL
jgi:hypothetical protein